MLAYGVSGDLIDEYLRMSETTYLDAMYKFCKAVIAVFGEVYLRQSNVADTACLLSINEARGFPGMIGSIDCMHWEWKNCLFAWQGSIVNMHRDALSFLRQLHRRIYGFGTLSLAWPVPTMTSTCSSGLWSSPGL